VDRPISDIFDENSWAFALTLLNCQGEVQVGDFSWPGDQFQFPILLHVLNDCDRVVTHTQGDKRDASRLHREHKVPERAGLRKIRRISQLQNFRFAPDREVFGRPKAGARRAFLRRNIRDPQSRITKPEALQCLIHSGRSCRRSLRSRRRIATPGEESARFGPRREDVIRELVSTRT